MGEEYYLNPHIEFLPVGSGEGVIVGGPIRKEGYYVFPCCDPLCCRPYGPFPNPLEALGWSREVMALSAVPVEDPIYARSRREARMSSRGRRSLFRRRARGLMRTRRIGPVRLDPSWRRAPSGLKRR